MACNPEATTLSSSSQTVASNSSSSSSSSDQNLFTSINRDKVWSVNTQSPESGKAVIKPWDKRFDATEFTQSLNDEDLKGMVIINVPFVCPVRIRSILINPGRGEFAVRRCRLFVNRPNGIDFEEIEAVTSSEFVPSTGPSSSTNASTSSTPRTSLSSLGPPNSGKAQADFALLEDQEGVTEYPVSTARFNNVREISVVLSHPPSASLSLLYYLSFKGTSLNPEKEAGERMDIKAANMGDAVIKGLREEARGASSNNVR